MKGINVYMHIIFKIIEEIQINFNMNLLNAKIGNFQIKLNQSKGLDVKLKWVVKNVMVGCNIGIILLFIIQKETNQ
jgi:hypothetical protein